MTVPLHVRIDAHPVASATRRVSQSYDNLRRAEVGPANDPEWHRLLAEGLAAEAALTAALDADDALHNALGLKPGDSICGIPESAHDCARVCLLPARHIEDGRWHAGLGGTWSLGRAPE